ncbi:MAG TPA: hydroxysqualene dehydroxylase HpnE [Stellaceae bacterium]|nr:hydroxysqualene dehydroxylase HpnE [Stellaceae bacterium]
MRATESTGRVHVVGAGLAGLAAAVALAGNGRSAVLYESAPHAGGRCRSYFDAELGCRIDNGNHLLLAGNRAALDYLERIGALGSLEGPPEAVFPFVDAATGERWTVRPNPGTLPWWVLRAKRRVPQTRATDYLAALALRRADPSATVAAVLDPRRRLFRRLWEPLAVAGLNTGVEQGSATLFWRILAETLGRGGAACRPLLPRVGLSESFVEPALARLRAQGAEIRFGERLKALTFGADNVSHLVFEAGSIALDSADKVILAVPAGIAARLVPGLIVPDRHSPIVNAHFRYAAPPDAPFFVGLVGGAAEWIFRKRGALSVTVSAADRIVDRAAPELRDLFWSDVALAYRLPGHPVPPARIVKERRATFLASPEQLKRRPRQTTIWRNLLLAGDYVDTGLPATIEGAIRSGFAAARLATDFRPQAFTRIAASGDRNALALTTEIEQERHRALQ